MSKSETVIKDLQTRNLRYASEKASIFPKFVKGQNPNIIVLTCSDSRVIPEYIFKKNIGEIFTIRVAGNVAIDPSIVSSLEYAVDHFDIDLLIIMGHTNCGAIAAAEKDQKGKLLAEIRRSFPYNKNHVLANLNRQIEMLPKRSKIIAKAIKDNKIKLVGAIYEIENRIVNFL